MITDRELDIQLAGAAGVSDTDLPALPDGFLAVLTAADESEPASVVAARQLVADAHEARTAPRPRRRRPSRTALVRAGVAVLAVAAAWTTAVLVVPSDRTPTRVHHGVATPTPGTPSQNGITLVSAQEITFPLSLDPVPKGLTPTFSRIGGRTASGETPIGFSADYRAADGDGFQIWIDPQNPRSLPDGPQPQNPDRYAVTEQRTVTVGGVHAQLVRGDYVGRHCTTGPSTPQQSRAPGEVCTTSFAYLAWQRPDGQWVWIWADDSYSTPAAVLGVAESLVDRPQPAGLQIGVAPAGWSVTSYENSGMSLASDADPNQAISLTLLERWRGYRSVDVVLKELRLTGPVQSVTVHGKPARVALGKGDSGVHDWWNVSAELPDGTLFLLQVSNTLTQEQALQIAEQVTDKQ